MKNLKSNVSRILVLLLAIQILALPLVSAMEMHRCSFSGKVKFSLGQANNCCFKVLKPQEIKHKNTLKRKSCCEKQQIVGHVNLNIKAEQNLLEYLNTLSIVENKDISFNLYLFAFSNKAIYSSKRLFVKSKSIYLILKNFRI